MTQWKYTGKSTDPLFKQGWRERLEEINKEGTPPKRSNNNEYMSWYRNHKRQYEKQTAFALDGQQESSGVFRNGDELYVGSMYRDRAGQNSLKDYS